MEFLIPLLVVGFLLLVLVTLIGHGTWLAVEWFIGLFGGKSRSQVQTLLDNSPKSELCLNCRRPLLRSARWCGACGAHILTVSQIEMLRDLGATLRQLERLYRSGALNDVNFRVLRTKIENERERLMFPNGRPGEVRQTSLFAPMAAPQQTAPPRPTVRRPTVQRPSDHVAAGPTPPPSVTTSTSEERTSGHASQQFGVWTADSDEAVPAPPVHKPPRRQFAEVLSAFMEESNIRWGEIVGGILIVGCSTALVISLWAQISRIPVLKFLIFTTVTAALFGVGFYTEHRWKLPTTSRGILTIASLLVPLNFLAIAAVSGSTAPPGALVIVSELVAPALFLCLVYFAGRVITPSWPHLLAAGVLGSSVGQLLIRHFAAADNSPGLLLALGAFPVICYVAATGWMLRRALADEEIDEKETNAIFITLGAITFAAMLPFGLLLFRSGPVNMSIMHLAPLVTLGGTPLLATGALLWKRVTRKEMVAVRMAGTSIALLGIATVLSGVVLSWPNPASIIPSALLNFAVFTAIGILLELPVAHVFAAVSLTLAYTVAFHVVTGHVQWQNPRVTSLLRTTAGIGTGQALAVPFVLFALTHEWLRKKARDRDAASYFFSACTVATVSLLFLGVYGFGLDGDPHYVSAILALYAAATFWFAWRRRSVVFTWVAGGLLFITLAQTSGSLLGLRFPWQATLLLFAAVCTVGALVIRQLRNPETERLFVTPLGRSAAGASVLAALCLLMEVILRGFEPASVLAVRTFWLSAIWFGLLVLSNETILFSALQMTITLGAVLATKSFLQRFDWYAHQPNAWLHPWALQIQGSVLGLICLVWVAIRVFRFRKVAGTARTNTGAAESEPQEKKESEWLAALRKSLGKSLGMPIAFDHLLAGTLIIGLVVLALFGAMTGVNKEFAFASRNPPAFNLAGFPHELIFGPGAWILLAILLATMVVNFSERRRMAFALGALVTLGAVCPLLAGSFESQFATASAWRWSAAIFLLVVSIALAFREELPGLSSPGSSPNGLAAIHATWLLIALTPLLLLTVLPVIDSVNYLPPRGPQAGFFRAMGSVALYGGPLLLAAVALGIQGVRRRSPAFALGTGMIVNLTVTVVHLVSISAGNGLMNRVVLTQSLQLNAIAAASVALLWMGTRSWWMRDPPGAIEHVLLSFQKYLAVALNAILIVSIGLHLIVLPYHVGHATFAAGSFIGWLAVLLTIAVVISFDKLFRKPVSVVSLAATLLAIGSLLAFGLARHGVSRWAGLHLLMGALVLTAWVLLLARDLPRFLQGRARGLWARTGQTLADDWRWDTVLWATLVGTIAVMVALRSAFADPMGAWWSIGTLIAMSALAAALNWVTFRRAYLYAAGILFNTSVSIWLWKYQSQPIRSVRAFVEANVVALGLAGIVWLWLELRARRVAPEINKNTTWSFHNLAALLSLFVLGGIVASRLGTDASVFAFPLVPDSHLLSWLALTSLALLLIACLWDREAKYSVAALYLAGLMLAGNALHELGLSPRRLGWTAMVVLAIYALIAGLIWRARSHVVELAQRFKIPPRIDPAAGELKWLIVFNSDVVAIVVGLALWTVLRFYEWPLRGTASLAVAAQALTFGLMAQGRGRTRWQTTAVAMLLLGAVFFGWSWLTPLVSGTWLNRAVILMAEMFAIVGLFGAGLDKWITREPEWTKAVRTCVPAMTIAGIVSLGFVLGAEVFYQIEFGAVRMHPLAILTVAITMAAGVAICIVFAVSPKHDPLGLSEQRRSAYVYAAEAMLALLFMHIRLTMPWLFTGFFERYWPLVVVGIAYLGVTISELLRRRRVLVLARPIERTGALLPLLPVLGFWIAASQVDYSLLLFTVGGLYGLLSILRQSFLFGLLAALAGNGGLWHLLHNTSDYRFWQHPQLWLIPAGLSVLIAAHLNRKDFSEAQMAGIRYLALLTIYVSSTADIFINGVARSPWLPLVLAALSILGVFGGIILRIRAFLLLGSLFLLLAIATMINYASSNFGWTWLWYVSGIVTGALIIATFAVFEKKRAEVLRVVDGLKDWRR